MSNQYTRAAFETAIAEERRERLDRTYYVTLWRVVSWYGGPEEGGWWGADHIPEQTARFQVREEAEAVARSVEELADRLAEQARREHGEQCLRELEWLEARGLDADYLPEPDGEESFFVTCDENPPSARYGERGYS